MKPTSPRNLTRRSLSGIAILVCLLGFLLSPAVAQPRPGPGGPGGPPGPPPGGPGGPGGRPPPPEGLAWPPPGEEPPPPPEGSALPDWGKPVQPSGVIHFSGETRSESMPFWESTSDNISPVYATNKSVITVTKPSILSSGTSSSVSASSASGLNAGVLVDGGSSFTIKGGSVSTGGKGANGIYSSGEGSLIAISEATITTSGTGAHGAMATAGGELHLTNTRIETKSTRSAAIVTDHGGGTILVQGVKAVSSGQNSPALYSGGKIEVKDSVIAGEMAEGAVIEAGHSLLVKNTSLSAGQKCGILLYRILPEDDGESSFSMDGGSIEAAIGPLFLVTNTQATIALSGVKLTSHSGILLDASASRWGREGDNGGHVKLTASAQSLRGDIMVDAASSATVSLEEGSSLTGSIHGAALSLDAKSKWEVTADSTLTSLTDPGAGSGPIIGNIVGNGHNVTYDPKLSANGWLEGKTFDLSLGGQLVPQAGN